MLFNSTIRDEWCNALVILIHKDAADLEIYRPISLLSHFYKLVTRIITARLVKKLGSYQLIGQSGFRGGSGTNDHLPSIIRVIEKSIGYNRPLALPGIPQDF